MADSKRTRDQKIYEMEVIQGVPIKAIAAIYGIGESRVCQIVKKESAKHQRYKDMPLKDRIVDTFSYLDEHQLDTIGRLPCSNVGSTMNIVFKYLIRTHVGASVKDIYQSFLNLRYDELIGLRNMGRKKVALVMEIQDLIRQNENSYKFRFLNDCTKVDKKDYVLF